MGERCQEGDKLMGNAVVLGAGGFIGGFLVQSLVNEGMDVVGVDIKEFADWHQYPKDGARFLDGFDVGGNSGEMLMLARIMTGADEVYNLAADMGGMGFIESNKLACMLSVQASTNGLLAAMQAGVRRYFYSSSACVYPGYLQNNLEAHTVHLKESDAYPADAEDGYGWEKLFSERMCRHAYEDNGLETRVARYHNVYGPFGTYQGGREKAPAAICRKVAMAALTGNLSIDIWGDGEQQRSFMFIDDCIWGTKLITRGPYDLPVNLGSSETVTINELVDVAECIAFNTKGKLHREYVLNAPQGVKGRSSDNTVIRDRYDWEPSISLLAGMQETFEWVYDQVKRDINA
jgi:nucleoside-diphosphate-sugar epimerase